MMEDYYLVAVVAVVVLDVAVDYQEVNVEGCWDLT